MRFDEPGVVLSRVYLNSREERESLLVDPRNLPTGFPSILNPTGMSNERKEYLYHEIRKFCKEETKDLVCPMH